jgi:hypothetical protein
MDLVEVGSGDVLSHFPVCFWIDWLLMIKNCLIESGTPCRIARVFGGMNLIATNCHVCMSMTRFHAYITIRLQLYDGGLGY